MRISSLVAGASGLILAGVLGGAAAVSQEPAKAAPSRTLVTTAEYELWQTELSNWGRWGKRR